MRRFLQVLGVSGVALFAASCTMTPAPAPAPVPLPTPIVTPPPPMGGSCDASRVQGARGQVASAAVLEQVTLGSDATSARVLRPGEMSTMEFNANRLSINVDAGNRIIDLRCG